MAERAEEAYGVLATLVYGDEKNPVLNGVVTSRGKTIGELLSEAWAAPGEGGTITVADALSFVSGDDLRRLRRHSDMDDLRMDGDDWADVIEECQTNPAIGGLTIADNDEQVSEGGRNVTFVDGDGNAVIAYRGTGEGQWDDDVTLLSEPITQHDKEALEYYRAMDDRYATVTPVGHSNGGHEAMYVAIMEGVTCYAYDGQGFNFEFYEQHLDQWLANAGCVNLYCTGADFVSCLLLYPGHPQSIHFLASQRMAGKDFGAYHSPITMFDQDMGFVPGVPSPLNLELRRFTAWMARQPLPMRATMTGALAPLVQSLMDGERPWDALTQAVMAQPGGLELALWCALRYPRIEQLLAVGGVQYGVSRLQTFEAAQGPCSDRVHDFSDATVASVTAAASALASRQWRFRPSQWDARHGGEGWYARLPIDGQKASVQQAQEAITETAVAALQAMRGTVEAIGSLDAASAVALGKIAERIGSEATDMANAVFASA